MPAAIIAEINSLFNVYGLDESKFDSTDLPILLFPSPCSFYKD